MDDLAKSSMAERDECDQQYNRDDIPTTPARTARGRSTFVVSVHQLPNCERDVATGSAGQPTMVVTIRNGSEGEMNGRSREDASFLVVSPVNALNLCGN